MKACNWMVHCATVYSRDI